MSTIFVENIAALPTAAFYLTTPGKHGAIVCTADPASTVAGNQRLTDISERSDIFPTLDMATDSELLDFAASASVPALETLVPDTQPGHSHTPGVLTTLLSQNDPDLRITNSSQDFRCVKLGWFVFSCNCGSDIFWPYILSTGILSEAATSYLFDVAQLFLPAFEDSAQYSNDVKQSGQPVEPVAIFQIETPTTH